MAADQTERLNLLEGGVRKLTRLFKTYVARRGPGRPRFPLVTRAEKLNAAGQPWRMIYPRCLPDPAFFESSAEYKKAQKKLRDDVRQRRNRAGIKPPKNAEMPFPKNVARRSSKDDGVSIKTAGGMPATVQSKNGSEVTLHRANHSANPVVNA